MQGAHDILLEGKKNASKVLNGLLNMILCVCDIYVECDYYFIE